MHPSVMYRYAKDRQTEFIREAEAFRLAQQVQGQQPNGAQALLNKVVAFTQRVGAKSIETAQTGEVPQIELSGEQP